MWPNTIWPATEFLFLRWVNQEAASAINHNGHFFLSSFSNSLWHVLSQESQGAVAARPDSRQQYVSKCREPGWQRGDLNEQSLLKWQPQRNRVLLEPGFCNAALRFLLLCVGALNRCFATWSRKFPGDYSVANVVWNLSLFGQTPHQRGKAMGFELYPATLERNHHPQVNLVNQTILSAQGHIHRWIL